VPELTSLCYSATAGNYGDPGYSGNCPGNLIRDLILSRAAFRNTLFDIHAAGVVMSLQNLPPGQG